MYTMIDVKNSGIISKEVYFIKGKNFNHCIEKLKSLIHYDLKSYEYSIKRIDKNNIFRYINLKTILFYNKDIFINSNINPFKLEKKFSLINNFLTI